MKKRIFLLFPVMVCAMVLFLTGCDSSDYRKAVNLYKGGKYEEAIAAFEALGDYRDCETRISDCKLGIAADLLSAGNAQEAADKYIEEFDSSGREEAANGIVSCIDSLVKSDISAATDIYKKVPDGAKNDSFKFLGGDILLRTGNLNKAKQLYESVPEDFSYNGVKVAERLEILNAHSDLLSICGKWTTSKDGAVAIKAMHDSTGLWNGWDANLSGAEMSVYCPYDIEKGTFKIIGSATYGYIKNVPVNSSDLKAATTTASFSVEGDRLPETLPVQNENVTITYSGNAFKLDFKITDDSSNLYFSYVSSGTYTYDVVTPE